MPNMDDFDRSVAFVLERETVFEPGARGDWSRAIATQEKNDRGGLTKFGIDQRSHPNVDINSLTLQQAKDIYKLSYWFPGRCDRMPWPICLAHLDACVNLGTGQAAKILQRIVGASPDGQVGPKTLAALASLLETELPTAVAMRLALARGPVYRKIVEADSSQSRFLKGWLNRVEKLTQQLC